MHRAFVKMELRSNRRAGLSAELQANDLPLLFRLVAQESFQLLVRDGDVDRQGLPNAVGKALGD
jgi:hypothetical protein